MRSLKLLGLLRFQVPMLKVFGRILFSGGGRKSTHVQPVTRTIEAIPEQLVEAYLQFCGANNRYQDHLPMHLVSHWGLPLVAELLLRTPLPVAKLLNQGVTFVVKGKLPRNQPLLCTASIQNINEATDRTRITVLLQTGTVEQPDLLETQLHMVIIHQRTERAKTKPETAATSWQKKGNWQAGCNDGLHFALITGDFNPIHWLSIVGKLSALNGKVLHGFATLARSVELLDANEISQIDFRFVRAVPLPSADLTLEQSEQVVEGKYLIRLRNPSFAEHLVGSVVYRDAQV